MEFPKRTKLQVSVSPDNMAEEGEELGLNADALDQFQYGLSRVFLEIEVNEDGTYKLVGAEER